MKGERDRPRLAGTVPVSLSERSGVGIVSVDEVLRSLRKDAQASAAYAQLQRDAAACRDSAGARVVLNALWGLFRPEADRIIVRKDPNFRLSSGSQGIFEVWAKQEWPLLATDRNRYVAEVLAGADPDQTWNDLRGTQLFTPTPYNERNADGLWDGLRSDVLPATLAELSTAAGRLKLKSGNSGMAFHVARANIQNGRLAVTTIKSVRDSSSKSAKDCYESRNLPVNMGSTWTGYILIHQDKTPCLHCCNGYKNWAFQRRCTIVVAVTDSAGYDTLPGNGTFIFSATQFGVHWQ